MEWSLFPNWGLMSNIAKQRHCSVRTWTFNIEYWIQHWALNSVIWEARAVKTQTGALRKLLQWGNLPRLPASHTRPINLEVLSCFQFFSLPIVFRAQQRNLVPLKCCNSGLCVISQWAPGSPPQPCWHMSFATIICVFLCLWCCPCLQRGLAMWHLAGSSPWAVLPCRALSLCSVESLTAPRCHLGPCATRACSNYISSEQRESEFSQENPGKLCRSCKKLRPKNSNYYYLSFCNHYRCSSLESTVHSSPIEWEKTPKNKASLKSTIISIRTVHF